MKKILSAIAIAAALGCSCAAASPLVTADVPLDSSYYGYLDKLEGMGYIHTGHACQHQALQPPGHGQMGAAG